MKVSKYILAGLVGTVVSVAYSDGIKDDLKITFGEATKSEYEFEDPETAISEVFILAERYLLGVVGVISVVMVLWVATSLLISKGNEEERTKALGTLKWLIIGLVVIPLGYVAVRAVVNLNLGP